MSIIRKLLAFLCWDKSPVCPCGCGMTENQIRRWLRKNPINIFAACNPEK